MQEIKFRAWIKSVETMVDVESIDFSEELITHKNLREDSLVDLEPASQIDPFYLSYFSDIELMQFTGLKDRSGVEIYEGDILKNLKHGNQLVWVYWEGCKEKYGDRWIKWGGWNFRKTLNDERLKYALHGDSLEVVGNIYEHPELLNN